MKAKVKIITERKYNFLPTQIDNILFLDSDEFDRSELEEININDQTYIKILNNTTYHDFFTNDSSRLVMVVDNETHIPVNFVERGTLLPDNKRTRGIDYITFIVDKKRLTFK